MGGGRYGAQIGAIGRRPEGSSPLAGDERLALAVFTIGVASAADCGAVLHELRRQTVVASLEILVVAPDRALEPELFEGFGAWSFVALSRMITCGEAMEAAVRAARAPFVTYAEEHATFRNDWAERLIEAHTRGYDVVGFTMENANPSTLTSWAHLYGQFGPVVAPVATTESGFLGGHHASYRRALLLGYGDALRAALEDEAALFLDLDARGVRMLIAGDAVSRHVNISSLAAYVTMDHVGMRSFAATRARLGGWPLWRRSLYAAAAPLIPFVRLRRIVADIRRSGRGGQLLPRVLAPIGLALIAGAWGEMLGYLLGPGDAAERKAPIELQRSRYLSAGER
jgi:hypothetical protein